MGILVSIDNGGTLTDFCAYDGDEILVTKAMTTPEDLSKCLFRGLTQLSELVYGNDDVTRLLHNIDYIRYSTTQGTNALVERRGPRIGLITSSGFDKDQLLSEEQRADLFEAIVGNRVGLIDEKLSGNALDLALTKEVNQLGALGANRIVVSMDSADYVSIEDSLQKIVLRRYPSQLLGALPITFAGDMSKDDDYLRRTWTALFNTFLHPAMEQFLYSAEHRSKQHRTRNPLLIYRNDGGVARIAKTIALKTYSSGPRGGMGYAAELARHYDVKNLISIDIGGTTSDISAVDESVLVEDTFGRVEGVEVSIPLSRIRSAGIGGSSIIKEIDGSIVVGPKSVGAFPGPACFDRSGEELTITDVLLLNGLIDSSTYFGGQFSLNKNRARTVLENKVRAPLGIEYSVALEKVEQTWVRIVAEKVLEHQRCSSDSTVVGFGGGGPMLLTAIASALGVKKAIIPGMAAVFSAYGVGFSNISQSYQMQVSGESLDQDCESQVLRAKRDMFAEGVDIDDCSLEFSLVDMKTKQITNEWIHGDSLPSVTNNHTLLRLKATKETKRLEFSEESFKNVSDAQASGERLLIINEVEKTVPVYNYSQLVAGARGEGLCVIEHEFFTARIDAGWSFQVSANHDLLMSTT